LRNPINESLIIQFVQKGQTRGHIFLVERYFIFNGTKESILVASDLVSKSDIPGSSLIIYKKALQHCKENKIALLNFSNKYSDQIYSQIMKIEPTLELDFQLGNFNYMEFFRILIKKLGFQTREKKILPATNMHFAHYFSIF
jgi:hypothetical protein